MLGEQDALTCVDLLPASAEGDLAKIMAHKIDLLTPWSAELGYAAQKIMARRRDGMLEVLVAAAARADLDRVLRQLAAVGVKPASVDVAIDKEPGRSAGLDLLHGTTPEPRRRGRVVLAVSALLVLALAGAGAGRLADLPAANPAGRTGGSDGRAGAAVGRYAGAADADRCATDAGRLHGRRPPRPSIAVDGAEMH